MKRVNMGFFILLMLVSQLFYVSGPNIISTKADEAKKSLPKVQDLAKESFEMRNGPTTSFEHNVDMRHCDFYGSIWAKGEADVYMEDIDFIISDSTKILVEDHAKVVINKSRFIGDGSPYLVIYLYNWSELYIYDSDFMFKVIYVYMYDNSKFVVDDGENITQFYVYDNSNLTIIGDFPDLDVRLYDSAELLIYQSTLTDTPNIEAYSNSRITLSYVNYTFDIDLYNNAELNAYSSTIYRIETNDSSLIDLYDTNVSELYVEWDSTAYLFDSNITYMDVVIGTHEGELKNGPVANIENSYVFALSIYSFMPTIIKSSEIKTLEYCNIYTGSVNITPTEQEYVHYSDSYINISSTIHTAINNTDYIFIHDASYVEINNVDDPGEIYLYDVEEAYIYNKRFSYKNLYIRAWNSYVELINGSAVNFDLLCHNASIYIENLGPVNTFDLDIYSSLVFMMNISSASMFWSSIDANNSWLYAINVSLNVSHMKFKGGSWLGANNLTTYGSSEIDFEDSFGSFYIMNTTKLKLDRSNVYLKNVSMKTLWIKNFYAKDGYFLMHNGAVNASMSDGDLIYGAMDYGNNTYDKFVIEDIDLYNATLNISGRITYEHPYYGGFYLYINLDKSVIYGYDLWAASSITIYYYLHDHSLLSLHNCTAHRIFVYSGTVYTYDNTEVLTEIEVHNGRLYLHNSSIDEISIYNQTYIQMDGCNISDGIYVEFDFEMLFYFGNYSIPEVTIIASGSNISEVAMIAEGEIILTNCSVEQLYYVYQNVTLNDTNVTYLLNTTLFRGGNVVIENNIPTSGSPISQLTIDGDCTINYVVPAVAFKEPIGGSMNIKIKDSNYFGVISCGGNVDIQSSIINLIMTFNSQDVTIKNVTLNSTVFEEMFNIFISQSCVIHNSTLLSFGILAVVQDNLNISDITSNVTCFVLKAGNGYIGDINVMTIDPGISILNSTFTIDGLNLTYFEAISVDLTVSNNRIMEAHIVNSTCVFDNVNISMLSIDDNSTLDIANSYLGDISLEGYYFYARNVDILTEDSNISGIFPMHYVLTSYKGTTFDNETITGEYDVTTNYISTNLATEFKYVLFEVTEYGKVRIENYSDVPKIEELYVDTKVDTNPPSITYINDTSVAYELGINYSLLFELSDETPTKYIVYLDGSKKIEDTYVDHQTISVDLSELITSAGDYTLKVYAYDSENNEAYVAVDITVYPKEPPVITSKPNNAYTIKIGEEILLEWVATDKSPDIYLLYVGDTLERNTTWESGVKISYGFSSRTSGTYNVTIVFYDKLGQSASHTVVITVKEEAKPSYLWLIIASVAVIIIVALILILRKKKKKE